MSEVSFNGQSQRASSRLKLRKVLGMGTDYKTSKVVQLLGLDDHLTEYPWGFGLWHTLSGSFFLATALLVPTI
jgi:hypothetical protein